jgi:hypothetical protein
VNTVCDHCLVFAYADQVRRVDRDIVEETIRYLDDGERPRVNKRNILRGWRMTPRRWTLLAVSAAAAGLVALAVNDPDVVRRVVELGGSSLSGLARSARALLPL